MDSATQDLLFQRLNELIFDEEKIVTCLTAASELDISLNEAKNLLEAYVKDCQELNSKKLHITYLLCGVLKDGKRLAVHQVKEDDLESKKCQFDTVSATIIYSVQKGDQIDLNAIALANSTCGSYTGHLVSKNYVKRNIKNELAISQPATTSADTSSAGNGNKIITKHEDSEELTQNSQKSSKAKQNGGITSFFSKAPSKSDIFHKVTDNKSKKEKSNTSPDVTQNGGIASFFSKAPSKSEISPKVADNETKKGKSDTSLDITQNGTFNKEQHCEKEETPQTEKMDTDNQEIKSNKGQPTKKRKKENKNNNPSKKRKRIQEVCDSDSSDMFDDNESEDIVEKSDDEPEQLPPVNSVPVRKNKVRKAIDKTYVDEEGFMVTTTEYIYESASVEENKKLNGNGGKELKILPEKKNTEIETQPKKPPATKGKNNKKVITGKQPTLMSFFKKN